MIVNHTRKQHTPCTHNIRDDADTLPQAVLSIYRHVDIHSEQCGQVSVQIKCAGSCLLAACQLRLYCTPLSTNNGVPQLLAIAEYVISFLCVITWNRVVRILFELPWTTHCNLLQL